ncbi:hypothetical protein VTN02DRAFT_6549 [Thermoascus thermophilus]
MAYRHQGLSRTLPKNFTFPSVNSGEPKTPEHPAFELQTPPPPRHASFRLPRPRVRAGTDIFAHGKPDVTFLNPNPSDVPLPSIEFPSEEDPEPLDSSPRAPDMGSHLQVPPRRRMDLRTPPAQIRTTPLDFPGMAHWTPGDSRCLGESIHRPSSACSNASDSSISSIETFTSQRSLGGSCTSPESEIQDPFLDYGSAKKPVLESPLRSMNARGKSHDQSRKERWTAEMDNHLWNTYQIYLQDPTITPFKMTPGSIPPLGVSHRVAREARRTWPKMQARANRHLGEGTAASAGNRSRSATPRAEVEKAKSQWPRSDASTRRRLKALCRRKFSIAPHYQRLLQSRSPEPFRDLFSRSSRESSQLGSSYGSSASFATRDLGVSLVSSSLPATLSQLSPQDHPSRQTDNHWFSNPAGQSVQQANNSPFSAGTAGLDNPDPIRRLGSPFVYNTWDPGSSSGHVCPTAAGKRRGTIHVTGSRLRSPPRLAPSSNVHKRRAQHPSEEDASPGTSGVNHHLQELIRLGKLKDVSQQRRIRIRNRGNTTGAINSRVRLEELFAPPSPRSASGRNDCIEGGGMDDRLHPDAGTIKRLGSPFKVDGLPRAGLPAGSRHAPSLSESFGGSSIAGQAFNSTRFPYDPTEEGITDAERIRRQILNMPFTQKES